MNQNVDHLKKLTDEGYLTRHCVIKQLYADLPEIHNCPLLSSLVGILLIYFEKNQVYYLLYNWLQSTTTLATSDNQISSDDNAMRDLGIFSSVFEDTSVSRSSSNGKYRANS